jgi:hypothetical protein
LNKWFSGKGFLVFEKLDFTYIREKEGCIDYVFISVGGKSHLKELYAGVSVGRKIASIEKYWEEYGDLLEVSGGLSLTVNVDPVDERGVSTLMISLTADDNEAVAKARDYIIQTCENVLWPEVESMTDIQELDREYNDVPDDRLYGAVETWFRKMAIAKLAGSENYQKVSNLFLTIYGDAIQTDPANKAYYEKLIHVAGEVDKKLKNVLPLSDPKGIV